MVPTKSVTVQYRRVEPLGDAFDTQAFDRDLAHALHWEVEGVRLTDRARLRQMPAGGAAVRLLNKHDIGDGFVFGELVRFEPGALIPLILQGEEAAQLDLAQAEAEAGSDLVQGLAYFMVRGQHMALIERGMRGGQLESYLTWLLQRAEIAGVGSRVRLQSRLVVEGAAGLANVKKAKLKLSSTAEDVRTREVEVLATGERRLAGDGTAWDVLRTAGITDAALTEAATEPNTKLNVDVSFSLKRGRNRVELPEETLSEYLESNPDDQFILESEAGRRVGRALILREKQDVEMVGVYIDPASAAQTLWASLQNFMEKVN